MFLIHFSAFSRHLLKLRSDLFGENSHVVNLPVQVTTFRTEPNFIRPGFRLITNSLDPFPWTTRQRIPFQRVVRQA